MLHNDHIIYEYKNEQIKNWINACFDGIDIMKK